MIIDHTILMYFIKIIKVTGRKNIKASRKILEKQFWEHGLKNTDNHLSYYAVNLQILRKNDSNIIKWKRILF